MKQFIQNLILTAIICLSANAYADNTNKDAANAPEDSASAYQKVIEKYKQHLAKTPPQVREEIKKYRLAIAKLQKQKRDLYIKLSTQAQDYLKQEENFRKMLPLESENGIDAHNQQAIRIDQSNKK